MTVFGTLSKQEAVLSEKQQILEGIEACLDGSLSVQNRLKSVLESKDTELSTVKDMMTKEIDTLQADLEEKNKELSKFSEVHKQEMLKLQHMHLEVEEEGEKLANLKEQQQVLCLYCWLEPGII